MFSIRSVAISAAAAFFIVFFFAHVYLSSSSTIEADSKTHPHHHRGDVDAAGQKKSHEPEQSSSKGNSWFSSASSSKGNKCNEKRFSSFRCIPPADEPTWTGDRGSYGFPLSNRSCLFENIVLETNSGSYPKFVLYLPGGAEKAHPPAPPQVSLSSRPFDLPHAPWKRKVVYKKMVESHRWVPEVRVGQHIPCEVQEQQTQEMREVTLGYYSPIVAPWNVAHTLLCDLFGLFWAAFELLGEKNVPFDMKIVAYGRHYAGDFPFPLKKRNVAFDMMSRQQPVYDTAMRPGLYGRMIAGIGTKSWSWVTPQYRASGSPQLWYRFRQHILRVVGIPANSFMSNPSPTGPASPSSPIRVSICHKKNDKRGIVNYEETLGILQDAAKRGAFGSEVEVEFVLETSVGLSVKKQVELMLRADVYLCNEGTLSTPFFLMSPGKVYLSLPLVQHGPHLHQKGLPKSSSWWRLPDPLRPDPRKNIGGNIDWFPQAIPWIRAFYYDYVPMNETRIQPPCAGCLRNYMPDFNIIVQRKRIVPLMQAAVRHVASNKDKWRQLLSHNGGRTAAGDIDTEMGFDEIPTELLSDSPNYSVTADICRQMMGKIVERRRKEGKQYDDPAKPFNTARCLYGMSWLCEFWANTIYKWRFFHGKWRYGHCGGRGTALEHYDESGGIVDPREKRLLSEFLFYNKEELLHMYNSTDFGRLKEQPDELEVKIFSSLEGPLVSASENAVGSDAAVDKKTTTGAEEQDDDNKGKSGHSS